MSFVIHLSFDFTEIFGYALEAVDGCIHFFLSRMKMTYHRPLRGRICFISTWDGKIAMVVWAQIVYLCCKATSCISSSVVKEKKKKNKNTDQTWVTNRKKKKLFIKGKACWVRKIPNSERWKDCGCQKRLRIWFRSVKAGNMQRILGCLRGKQIGAAYTMYSLLRTI